MRSGRCYFIRDRGHHEKWMGQIEYIVEKLHSHDIVWGSVGPYNIIINESNACFMDFSGVAYMAFIDEKIMETREGDWQGVGRIYNDWLPMGARELEGNVKKKTDRYLY